MHAIQQDVRFEVATEADTGRAERSAALPPFSPQRRDEPPARARRRSRPSPAVRIKTRAKFSREQLPRAAFLALLQLLLLVVLGLGLGLCGADLSAVSPAAAATPAPPPPRLRTGVSSFVIFPDLQRNWTAPVVQRMAQYDAKVFGSDPALPRWNGTFGQLWYPTAMRYFDVPLHQPYVFFVSLWSQQHVDMCQLSAQVFDDASFATCGDFFTLEGRQALRDLALNGTALEKIAFYHNYCLYCSSAELPGDGSVASFRRNLSALEEPEPASPMLDWAELDRVQTGRCGSNGLAIKSEWLLQNMFERNYTAAGSYVCYCFGLNQYGYTCGDGYTEFWVPFRLTWFQLFLIGIATMCVLLVLSLNCLPRLVFLVNLVRKVGVKDSLLDIFSIPSIVTVVLLVSAVFEWLQLLEWLPIDGLQFDGASFRVVAFFSMALSYVTFLVSWINLLQRYRSSSLKRSGQALCLSKRNVAALVAFYVVIALFVLSIVIAYVSSSNWAVLFSIAFFVGVTISTTFTLGFAVAGLIMYRVVASGHKHRAQPKNPLRFKFIQFVVASQLVFQLFNFSAAFMVILYLGNYDVLGLWLGLVGIAVVDLNYFAMVLVMVAMLYSQEMFLQCYGCVLPAPVKAWLRRKKDGAGGKESAAASPTATQVDAAPQPQT